MLNVVVHTQKNLPRLLYLIVTFSSRKFKTISGKKMLLEFQNNETKKNAVKSMNSTYKGLKGMVLYKVLKGNKVSDDR